MKDEQLREIFEKMEVDERVRLIHRTCFWALSIKQKRTPGRKLEDAIESVRQEQVESEADNQFVDTEEIRRHWKIFSSKLMEAYEQDKSLNEMFKTVNPRFN